MPYVSADLAGLGLGRWAGPAFILI